MTPPTPVPLTTLGRARSKGGRVAWEGLVRASLMACASFSILVTFSIIIVLFQQTAGFFGVHGDDTPGSPNRIANETRLKVANRDSIGLNEIRVAQPGDKLIRYVELAGPVGASLQDLSLVILSGRGAAGESGVITAAIPLDGQSLGERGYFLISPTTTVFGARPDRVEPLDLDDDDNLTILLVRGFSGQPDQDLDADNDGRLDRTPWTEVIDDIALVRFPTPDQQNNAASVYSDTRVGPFDSNYLPLHVLRHPTTGEWRMGAVASTHVTFLGFITGTEWNPLLGAEKHFGVWPLIAGTVLVATIAMCIAIPFGLITAIFLSEYAPRRLRAVLKPALEVLAGIPTVVYGFFALTVITPLLRELNWMLPASLEFGPYNAMSAGIAVGIMCLPIVSSLSEDALQAVPRSLREGAYALGGTRFDVSVKVVTPAALSGIVAAFLLAIARAVGETMIVALAAGGAARLTANPADEVQTMTAYMVQIFLGDASNFGPEYLSAYAVGATLFIITLILTLIGGRILKRFREVYE